IWQNGLTTVHFYYNYETPLFVWVTYEHAWRIVRPDHPACEATDRAFKFCLRGLFEERETRMLNRAMPKIALIVTLSFLLSIPIATHAQPPASARIKVDIDRQIGEVDPLLFGNFSEHLGRMIYGG